MRRRIVNIKWGQVVTYMGRKYEVARTFTYIAYLRDVETKKVICVGVGDLVMAGLEPSLPVSYVF